MCSETDADATPISWWPRWRPKGSDESIFTRFVGDGLNCIAVCDGVGFVGSWILLDHRRINISLSESTTNSF